MNILSYSSNIQVNAKHLNVHTIKCGNFELPVLVLLHGYGGSCIGYYKMLQCLSECYKVYAFDWPGMGLSDRCDFGLKVNDTGNVIDFFVEILEGWR